MRHWWVLIVLIVCIGLALAWKLVIDAAVDPKVEETDEQAATRRYRTVLGVGVVVLAGILVLVLTSPDSRKVVGTMTGNSDDLIIGGLYDDEEEEVPVMSYPTKIGDTEALEILIEENPRKNWNWADLSYNPYITYDLVQKFSSKKWSRQLLVENAGIKIEEAMRILNNDSRNPLWPRLAVNPNITIADYDKYLKPAGVPLGAAMASPNITISEYYEYLGDHPNTFIGPLLSHNASANPNITVQDFVDHPELFAWREASNNKSLLFSDIVKHPDLNGQMQLSSNPSIDVNFVINHPTEFSWDEEEIAENPAVNLDHLEKLEELGFFSFTGLASNPNLTIKDIRSRPKEDWDWIKLSGNKGISIDTILSNLDLPWNFYTIASKIGYSDALRTKVYKRPDWDWDAFSDRKLDTSKWAEFVKQRDMPSIENRRAMKSIVDEMQSIPAGSSNKPVLRRGGPAAQRLERVFGADIAGIGGTKHQEPEEARVMDESATQNNTPPSLESRQATVDEMQQESIPVVNKLALRRDKPASRRPKRAPSTEVADTAVKRPKTEEDREMDERERYFAVHGYDEVEFPFQEEYDEPVDNEEETMPVFHGGGSKPPKIMGMEE